jgi:peptidoglycan hydrolase-like protein with peptidoglycan-binding domain/GH25 family lysozyme M1 (1,4-beta-N-acetylmuramidase)
MRKKLISIFLALALVFSITLPAAAMQPSSSVTYKGIDISSWEPGFDFMQAAQEGVQVAYLRTSYATHINGVVEYRQDASFRRHLQAAQAAGIKTGGYHFLYLGNGYTVEDNLNIALAAVQGVSFDCKYVIDFEAEGLRDTSLSKEQITADVLEFADRFTAATGIPCAVYGSTYFIKEHYTSDILRLPVWIADYRANANLDENTLYSKWIGFQYSDEIPCSNSPEIDADTFTSDVLLDGKTVSQPMQVQQSSSDVLRLGSLGDDVSNLQSNLNKLGYGLTVDGSFGPLTEKAVISFQSAHSLDPDGVAGPLTYAKITNLLNGSDSSVLEIQQNLNRLGIASLTEDGISGPCTQAAIRSFQSIAGISVDGIYGSQSAAAYQVITDKPTLRQGSTGIAGRYIQWRVGAVVDGVYGPDTAAAVEAFESSRGIEIDGITGAHVWAEMGLG